MPEPRPLYNLPEIGKAGLVLVVEGEKAADAAQSLGLVATTSAGGSNAASKTDWRPLAGKRVLILPDNDTPGRKYADDVADILTNLKPALDVRIVDLPGLPEGGDLVEWIDGHGDAAEPETIRANLAELARSAEPLQHDGDDLRFRPFPFAALPQPARALVTAGAEAICCDHSLPALPVLSLLAAAIGNTRRLRLKHGWNVPPILWTAIVAESGNAKTPALDLVLESVRDREERAAEQYAKDLEQYEVELTKYQKEHAIWKQDKKSKDDPPEKPEPPPCPRYAISDTTVEALAAVLRANPRGVLLNRDELNGWFGMIDRFNTNGKGGSDSAHWLSMYNAQTVIIDRKTGYPNRLFIPQAAVCITGGIQPGILKRALSAENRESGLAARFLVAYPPRRKKVWTEAEVPPRTRARFANAVDRLFELQPDHDGERPRPRLVGLSPEAKKIWLAFHSAHNEEQVNMTGDLAAAWSKLEEIPARLALVIHFTRWAANDPTLASAEVLDAESMKAGVTLAEWFKHEARRIYAMMAEDEEERDRRRLVEFIQGKGGCVTAREVRQGCSWLKGPGKAEEALIRLVRAGLGEWVDSPAGRPGRPTRHFRLFEASTVYETPEAPEADGGFVDVDARDESETGEPDPFLFDPDGDGPYQ